MYRLSGLQDTHALTALHWWSTVADNQPKLSRHKHYTQFTDKLEPSFLLYPKHIIPTHLWQLRHCWTSDNQFTWLHPYFAYLFLKAWNYVTRWWQQSVYVAKVDARLWKWVNIYIVGRSNSFSSSWNENFKHSQNRWLLEVSIEFVRYVKILFLFILNHDIMVNWLQLWEGNMRFIYQNPFNLCVNLSWTLSYINKFTFYWLHIATLHYIPIP